MVLSNAEEELGQTNETALKHIAEFDTIKETVYELYERIELEAGSITQDQKYFAEYLHGIKNFKPWMDDAESTAKAALEKPVSLEQAKQLLETVTKFEEGCNENKTKLDSAAESRSKMEKQTKADDEVQTLQKRLDTVKKIATERVTKIQELCNTWNDLQQMTEKLATAITEIPGSTTPDVTSLEGIFKEFRTVNDKKVKLLSAI